MPHTRFLALALVAALSIALVPAPASAWGREGHWIVARIAASRLRDRTKDEIRRLLGEETLESGAVWADDVRSERPETSNWHFVNIPLRADVYDAGRDCQPDPKRGDCIVQAIARQVDVLRDPASDATARQEALKYVVHFVGDLHQPLHCASRFRYDKAGNPVLVPGTSRHMYDRGGNDFRCSFMGQEWTPYTTSEGKPVHMQLHYVWDSALILHRLGAAEPAAERVEAYATELVGRLTPERVAAARTGDLVGWAEDGAALARAHVYRGIYEYQDLPESYYLENIAVVDEQLMRAGVRLADLLNAILDPEGE